VGCDFFYSGSLPDPQRQQKVIEFLKGYFKEVDVEVQPQPQLHCRTLIQSHADADQEYEQYPFDFYGLVPSLNFEHAQFVFDRNDGGRLVRFVRFPADLGDPQGDLLQPDAPEVIVKHDGYYRAGTNTSKMWTFALILNFLQIRYWPDLQFSDDHNSCHKVGQDIWRWRLVNQLADPERNMKACYDLYWKTHIRHHPSLAPKTPAPSRSRGQILRELPPDIGSTKLEDLELSVRTRSCLRRQRISTIAELLQYKETDLLKMKNFGRKSLNEIKEILAEFGLHLPNAD